MIKAAKLTVILLLVQFLLGMLVNFYVKIPQDNPGLAFQQSGLLIAHSLLAVLLLVSAGVCLWLAIKTKQSTKAAVSGIVSILVAFIAGHIFVGTQNDLWSLVMALGFIAAVLSYVPIAWQRN